MKASAVEKMSREVIAELGLSRAVIVQVGLPQVREPRAARSLAAQLVRVVASVLRRVQFGQIFVEGGATAAELVRRMAWGRLKVLREVAPGVTTLQVSAAPFVSVTMKPGSYAWPDQIRSLTCLTFL